MVDINNDFEQNQLFEENTLITDKKMQKKSGSSNIRAIILTSIITSSLVVSSFYFLGFFDEVVIPPQETITITETVKSARNIGFLIKDKEDYVPAKLILNADHNNIVKGLWFRI